MSHASFYPYAHQHIDSDDLKEVSSALSDPVITRGERVEKFERSIAEYCEAKFAVAFNSGTTALIAACHAARINSSDHVITTPNSFVATTTAAMRFGALPVFVDIDLDTGNLDLDQVEANLRERRTTRGRAIVIPVHFSGIPVDMKHLDRMICSPDTVVIEDAAHAIGSSYKDGKKVGSCEWSQMTIFSFHAIKTITTGEGGMVLTNDADLYQRLKSFRNNGIERNPECWIDPFLPYEGYYQIMEMTGNYNFTEFQAALGYSQLKKIELFVKKRRELVHAYKKALSDMPYIKMFSDRCDEHTAFHIFVVQIDFASFNTTRENVIMELKKQGVGTQVHYIPIYRHPFFQNKSGDISSYFPQMEQYYSQALTLPLYYDLEEGDVNRIVSILKDTLIRERQKKKPRKSKRT